ncbi:hypothetical protein [Deinococcus aquiradiocola]|uniref:Bacterial transcriptional activator domain-containing protein n=1 Tax=Deinococcus aquiradiocola TaxID=393059 RepID=A0A917UQR8_9DEIO|nr:hypothetical protein [Deinococcus aquiradiocola]GGJ77043.1 hypothetical protein GCM10008939_21410 [Deinococcus aquiradiocola]
MFSTQPPIPHETTSDLLTFRVQGETKPLLMLAYVLLEGEATRSDLGRLFWPSSDQPANNLNVALSKLRKWKVGLTVKDGTVRVSETCGAALRRGLVESDFLGNVPLRDVGAELEGWVLDQRERLAGQRQDALLNEAQRCPDRQAQLTEQAWQVPGAPLPDARTLARFLCLCGSGTQVERLVRQELADLTDGWLTPNGASAGQALLAWWLDGGFVRLEGAAATVTAALSEMTRTLELDALPVHRLAVRPGTTARALSDSVGRLVQDRSATQTVVLDAPSLQPDEVTLLQLNWPDVRFIALGTSEELEAFTLSFVAQQHGAHDEPYRRPIPVGRMWPPASPRSAGVVRWVGAHVRHPTRFILRGPARPGPFMDVDVGPSSRRVGVQQASSPRREVDVGARASSCHGSCSALSPVRLYSAAALTGVCA